MSMCETCKYPIYPPGVTFTGVSCMFGGNHPRLTETRSNLVEPIAELTLAIKKLTKALKATNKPNTRGE